MIIQINKSSLINKGKNDDDAFLIDLKKLPEGILNWYKFKTLTFSFHCSYSCYYSIVWANVYDLCLEYR